MFSVHYKNIISYKTCKDFNSAIMTDTIEKSKYRTSRTREDKLKLPAWHFAYNLESTAFDNPFDCAYKLIPNEIFEKSKVQFTGLVCIDVDRLKPNEIDDIKGLCHTDNNIIYCARSVSCNGLFMLYSVGVPNQINTINLYKEIFPMVEETILHKVRRNIHIDPVSLSVLTLRFESYDPEPYNNFGETQW